MGLLISVTNDQKCWKTKGCKLVGLTPIWGSVPNAVDFLICRPINLGSVWFILHIDNRQDDVGEAKEDRYAFETRLWESIFQTNVLIQTQNKRADQIYYPPKYMSTPQAMCPSKDIN